VESAPDTVSLAEEAADRPDESDLAADWPEPEGNGGGNAPSGDGAKRKRRRKKKSAGGNQNGAPQGESDNGQQQSAAASEGSHPQQARPNPQQRPRPDTGKLAKRAWKIYLAEISEEGVALVGDNDAKELCRRCFRLAEIFLDEEGRRH
jgi:hypothetical protein